MNWGKEQISTVRILTKNKKILKKKKTELKNTIIEVKNTLEGINRRLVDTEKHKPSGRQINKYYPIRTTK